MSTRDDANDDRVDPEIDVPNEAEPTETDPTQLESVLDDSDDGDDRDDDDLEAVDVRLGPNETPITTDSLQQDGEDAGAFDEAAFDPTVDQPDAPFIEPPPTTLPILDEDGNIPEFLDGVARGLELWEEAAAEVPGDPHFTPLPVQKPRKAMLLMDRGPSRPIVWLDREIMTPVLYEGEKPAEPPASSNQPDAFPQSDEVVDAQQQLGVSRAPLVVTVARAQHHFLAALDQRVPQWDARSRAIAQEVVDYERWSQRCQERAIYGDY
jgi:hypothetical protein